MDNRFASEGKCRASEFIPILREAMPDLELCSRRAFECILAVPTYMPKGFDLATNMDSASSFICRITAGNTDYSATLSLAMDRMDFAALMPGASDEDMQMDALGEIANVIAGSFLGRKSILSPFGNMLPSPPLFSNGDPAARNSWRIHGALQANGVEIFLDFMIISAKKDACP